MGRAINPSRIVPCRNCKMNVSEAAISCEYCGVSTPGIDSQCPTCGSFNYEWREMGYCLSRGLAGTILLGPVGAFLGAIGTRDVECICRNCGQGWMPFAMMGGKLSTTKKYKR